MELDQFKQKWQRVNAGVEKQSFGLRRILRPRHQDPIAAMKRNFRRQVILLILVFFLLLQQFRDKEIFNNVFFDWYLVCGFCLCLFFYMNLRIVKQLEKTDQTVTAHLKSQVALLEKRMRWHRMFTGVAIASLIVLLEVLPLFSTERMLHKWHSISPAIRIAAYVALLLFQYYIKRIIAHRKYGQHLERLKKILNDADK